MKPKRFFEPEHSLTLKFYEQRADVIVDVIDAARHAHPGICEWSQAADHSGKKPCIAVTLQFRDKLAFDDFRRDEEFVQTYLESAWGRRALARDSLIVRPTRDARDIIPSDMFNALGM